MFVYDMTKRQSFDHMARWLEELRGHADKNILIVLIGNKCDLGSLQAVPTEDARENHDPRVKWASKCDPTDNGPTL